MPRGPCLAGSLHEYMGQSRFFTNPSKIARRSSPSAERCSWDPPEHSRTSDSRWRHSVDVTECRHREMGHLQRAGGYTEPHRDKTRSHFPRVVTRQVEPLSCRVLPMLQPCWPELRHHNHDFQCCRRHDSEHPHEEPVIGARCSPTTDPS